MGACKIQHEANALSSSAKADDPVRSAQAFGILDARTRAI